MPETNKAGRLRGLMPVTAWLVDELRGWIGRERADGLLRASQQGKATLATGRLHAVEVGPDGVRREFGQAEAKRR